MTINVHESSKIFIYDHSCLRLLNDLKMVFIKGKSPYNGAIFYRKNPKIND